MSDDAYQSFFGTSAPRWMAFKDSEPAYHAAIGSFITALGGYGIATSRPVVADTHIFTHAGLRRLIEDFIQHHPGHPLPLERITLACTVQADSPQAVLVELGVGLASAPGVPAPVVGQASAPGVPIPPAPATEGGPTTGIQGSILRFSKAYNIGVDLNLYLHSFDAGLAARICAFREEDVLETITLIYGFPAMTPGAAALWRSGLATFLEDHRSRLPGIHLAGFPLCFAPARHFKALLRYSLNDLKGLIGAQRRSIQTVLGTRRDTLTSCTTCRCRAVCYSFTDLINHPDHEAVLIPQTEDTVAFVGGSLGREVRNQKSVVSSQQSEIGVGVGIGIDSDADSDADARKIADIVFTSPAEQGDMLMVVLAGFRNILIMDGYFYSKFPCTTFEVMLALEQGLNVFGASSIGALRAVELDHYGMTGVGYVYEYLKRQRIKPYHIVAQTYTEEDTALTTPLVEVIYFLECAVAEGVLSPAESIQAQAVADEIPFPLLSFDYFFTQLESCENGLLKRLRSFFESKGPAFFSIKQKDAIQLLTGFRAILAGRNPAHVRETYRQACETYMSRLHRKYADGHDLSLPKDWMQTMPCTPTSPVVGQASVPGAPIPPAPAAEGGPTPSAAGRRALPAAETCRLAEAFFSDLDVVVADTTGYDPPAGSFIINIFFPPLYFLGYPLSCSTGNGDVFEEALASAYMELVERIPTHNFRIDAVRSDQLDQDPMTPDRIPQYYNFAASALVKQQVVQDHGYVRVTEVFSGKHFMIPRFAVMSMFTGTDGNAAGNTLSEAILYGIYELVERDTNQLYQYDPVCRDHMARLRIDPGTLTGRRVRLLLQRFEDKGLRVELFLLPNTFDLPCIRCRVYDLNREIECHGSTAVRADFQAAVFATLHEAYMQHISYFTGIRDDYRSLQSLKEAHIAYQNAFVGQPSAAGAPTRRGQSPGLHPKEDTTVTSAFVGQPSAAGAPASFATIPEELEHVMGRLKAAGMTCMMVADTSPEEAFVVKSVKVIIPGMELWFVPEYQPSAYINRRAQQTRIIMERF